MSLAVTYTLNGHVYDKRYATQDKSVYGVAGLADVCAKVLTISYQQTKSGFVRSMIDVSQNIDTQDIEGGKPQPVTNRAYIVLVQAPGQLSTAALQACEDDLVDFLATSGVLAKICNQEGA